MTLIGWCFKNHHHVQITISDTHKNALKIFGNQRDEDECNRHAIWHGTIEAMDNGGSFIKAAQHQFYARNRSNDAIGKSGLWQIQKKSDGHKLPRCSRAMQLENYYFRYHDIGNKISFAPQIENKILQKTLVAWWQNHPAKRGSLLLKNIGGNMDSETLIPHAETLIQQANNIHAHKVNGLVQAPPTIVQQALCLPITQWFAHDNHTALYLKNQIGDLPIDVAINDEAKAMIDDAENIAAEEIYRHQYASIICQSTEICHVMDVNSGGLHHQYQASALDINLLLLPQICQLIYLKNLFGVILIDFIGMNHQGNHLGNQQKLQRMLKKETKSIAQKMDKAPIMLHGWTRTNLFELEYRNE